MATTKTYGFTTAGWRTPTWQQLRDDTAGYVRSRFGASVRTDRESVVGKVVDIGTYVALGVYEGIGTLQSMLDPSQATGTYLDAAALFFGTTRKAAVASYADITVTAPAGTTVPAGASLRIVGGDGTVWTTDAVATVASGDTTVVSRATCSTTGPREAAAATSWEFVSTFTGYEDVTGLSNAADAAVGRAKETDAALRTRILSTQVPGPTARGIRAAILDVTGVTHCTVTTNRTEATVDTVPAGAFEAVVWPATSSLDDGIAEAIWTYSSATGAGSFGGQTRTVTDSEGVAVDVSWTRGTSVDIDVTVVTTRSSSAPADWSAQIDAAMDAYLETLDPGVDVSWAKVSAAALGFSWITSGTVTIRRDSDAYAASDIAIGARELAVVGTYVIS